MRPCAVQNSGRADQGQMKSAKSYIKQAKNKDDDSAYVHLIHCFFFDALRSGDSERRCTLPLPSHLIDDDNRRSINHSVR
jgi:hypothetical protein